MSIRDIVLIALFAAITAVLGLFPPLPVPLIPAPITAQTLGVMLAGSILGAKRGFLAMALFLVLVALGLPLLSGGRGGIGIFAGPTGGFALAWPFAAGLVGWLTEKWWDRLNMAFAVLANLIGGIGLIYLIGIPWLATVAKLPFDKAAMGALAFVPGDIIKALVAAAIAVTIRKVYPIVRRA